MNLNLPKATYIKVLREIESYTYVKLLKVPKAVFCWKIKERLKSVKKEAVYETGMVYTHWCSRNPWSSGMICLPMKD